MKDMSFTDSEDELPLTTLKSDLRKLKKIHCDFCDEISTSRYENMKHNASHIIIPLVNLNLHQCEECLHHFTSIDELIIHSKAKKHEISQLTRRNKDYDVILQSIIKKQLVIKCHDIFKSKRNSPISVCDLSSVKSDSSSVSVNKSDINSELHAKHTVNSYKNVKEQLKTVTNKNSIKDDSEIIKQETFLVNSDSEDELLQLVKNERITKYEHIPEHVVLKKTEQTDGHEISQKFKQIDDDDEDYMEDDPHNQLYFSDGEFKIDESTYNDLNVDTEYEPVRNRIMFEEDAHEDSPEEILPDLPEIIPNKHIFGKEPNKIAPYTHSNNIIQGSDTYKLYNNDNIHKYNNGITNNDGNDIFINEEFGSIHNDILKEDGLCHCRHCGRCFNNRFDLICHEAIHIHIKKPRNVLCTICETFFSGSYKSLGAHRRKAHPDYDPDAEKRQVKKCPHCNFPYYNYRKHILKYHTDYKSILEIKDYKTCKYTYNTIQLCNSCIEFNDPFQYKYIGKFRENGLTQTCGICQNKQYDINLMRLRHRTYNILPFAERKKGLKGNAERLARIKKRLGFMNKLTKLLCCVYLCCTK